MVFGIKSVHKKSCARFGSFDAQPARNITMALSVTPRPILGTNSKSQGLPKNGSLRGQPTTNPKALLCLVMHALHMHFMGKEEDQASRIFRCFVSCQGTFRRVLDRHASLSCTAHPRRGVEVCCCCEVGWNIFFTMLCCALFFLFVLAYHTTCRYVLLQCVFKKSRMHRNALNYFYLFMRFWWRCICNVSFLRCMPCHIAGWASFS